MKINFYQFQANWMGSSLNQFSNVWLVSCWCLMAMFLHTATYDVSNISLMPLMMYLVCHKMCVLTSYIFGWLGFWQGECWNGLQLQNGPGLFCFRIMYRVCDYYYIHYILCTFFVLGLQFMIYIWYIHGTFSIHD